MKSISTLLIMAVFVAFMAGCQRDNQDGDPANVEYGYVKGTVVSQNGEVPIPGANVFVDDNGEVYLVKTDKNGYFYLKAPIGDQVINVQSGDGSMFRAQYNVSISKDNEVALPDGMLKLTQAVELAYIPGAYDQIEVVLIDSLGYNADMLQVSDLSNLTLMQTYGAIFLNCGKSGALDASMYDNLETYVLNGGNLYASDYAVEYLTGDGYVFSPGSNPNAIHNHQVSGIPMKSSCGTPEVGGFINDSLLCTDKEGPSTILYQTNIVDPDIQAFLGQTMVDVEYDLGAWEIIKDCMAPWEVLISDVNFGPLAIRMNFPTQTSLKNMMDQGWVTICHIPPGNPANAHTITVSINALPAHLAHGDYVGDCIGGAGTIYYTTFHNHVQGNISSDIYQIMQYFILNL